MWQWLYWVPVLCFIVGHIVVFVGLFTDEKVRNIGWGIVGIPGILLAVLMMII